MTIMPIMQVGKYAGTPIDQLPNHYLRWMITQDFPKNLLEIAATKLAQSPHDNTYINVTRHAIDMFSKRFIGLWLTKEAGKEEGDGIATFLAKLAEEAWIDGTDESKQRHQHDGIVRVHRNIKFVFGVNPSFPDYKEVITVMNDN